MIFTDKDRDALDKALYASAENAADRDAELFDALDDEGVSISAELDESVSNIINGAEKLKRSARAATLIRRVGVRIAAAVIAMAVITVPLMTNVSAKARDEWKVRCDEIDFFFVVRYLPDLYNENAAHVPPPRTIETVHQPYVPVKDCLARDGTVTETLYSRVYERGGEEIMTFQQKVLTLEDMVAVTSYNGAVRVIDIGGYDGLLFEYTHSDVMFLFWNDGEYAYKLQSKNLSASQLISAAKRMK